MNIETPYLTKFTNGENYLLNRLNNHGYKADLPQNNNEKTKRIEITRPDNWPENILIVIECDVNQQYTEYKYGIYYGLCKKDSNQDVPLNEKKLWERFRELMNIPDTIRQDEVFLKYDQTAEWIFWMHLNDSTPFVDAFDGIDCLAKSVQECFSQNS